MEQRTVQIFFALLRSAVCGTELTAEEKTYFSHDRLKELFKIADEHDVSHILALGLKRNGLVPEKSNVENYIFRAVFRSEQLNCELKSLCETFEEAQIQFIPLKGAVMREYYCEPWQRTGCDVDVLVRREELERAVSHLVHKKNYVEKERTAHDVSLFSPSGVHVELHFDLIEEGRAKGAVKILDGVWDNVRLSDGCGYRYEMSDEFFYLYHVAHMAKHFENGGCGVRPFMDLFILDGMKGVDGSKRDELLKKSELLRFAEASRKLSRIWFGGEAEDELSNQMSDFVLCGGSYGTAVNRVAANKKNGGKISYVLNRIFVPYSKLKGYYPILEKHKWLLPVMQIRRWFMLFDPEVRRMAKSEIAANGNVSVDETVKVRSLLNNIGL